MSRQVAHLSKYCRMDAPGDEQSEGQVAMALVSAVAAGDRQAETGLVTRYQRGLGFFLRRETRGDVDLAEDIAQDTFRIVLERLRDSGIDNPERLAGYIHSTARYVLIGWQRKQSRRNTYADTDQIERTADDSSTQASEVNQEQTAQLLRSLLKELPTDRDRAILTRFYLHQEDKASICHALELSDMHFNRVLYRAKQRFKALLEDSKQFDQDDHMHSNGSQG